MKWEKPVIYNSNSEASKKEECLSTHRSHSSEINAYHTAESSIFNKVNWLHLTAEDRDKRESSHARFRPIYSGPRKFTNPISLIVFLVVWLSHCLLLGTCIRRTPDFNVINLTDLSGDVCGAVGSAVQEYPYLTYTVNIDAYKNTELPHLKSNIMDWLNEPSSKENWPLLDLLLYDEAMVHRVCVKSCNVQYESLDAPTPRMVFVPSIDNEAIDNEAIDKETIDNEAIDNGAIDKEAIDKETIGVDIMLSRRLAEDDIGSLGPYLNINSMKAGDIVRRKGFELPEYFPSLSEEDCPYGESMCRVLPLGLTKPLVRSVCLPRLPSHISYLQHPAFSDILRSTFTWLAALPQLPLSLSESSLESFAIVSASWPSLCATATFVIVVSFVMLLLLPYLVYPISRICIYILPLICVSVGLYGASMIIYGKLRDGMQPVVTKVVDLIYIKDLSDMIWISIIAGAAVVLFITVCLTWHLKRKLDDARCIIKGASVINQSTSAPMLPLLMQLLLTFGFLVYTAYGIFARAVIEGRPDIPLFIEKVPFWVFLIFSVFLCFWTAGMLASLFSVSISLMTVLWTRKVSWDLRKPTGEYEFVRISQCEFYQEGFRAVNHTGTAVLAGFFTSVTQTLRVVVRFLLKRIEKVTSSSAVGNKICFVRFVTRILQGLRFVLAVMDKAVRFLSKQTMIHCALRNDGFFASACASFQLMLRQSGDVISTIAFVRLTKMCLTVIVVATGIIFIQLLHFFGQLQETCGLLYILVALMSWFVSSNVFGGFVICSDTLLHIELLRRETEKT